MYIPIQLNYIDANGDELLDLIFSGHGVHCADSHPC